jgi:hypothetical protein
VNLVVPAQDSLEHQLRLAVRIDRPLRERLVDRQAIGRTECGARRAENETPAANASMASSRLIPPETLLRKYFDGFSIDSPTSAFAAKCITAFRLHLFERASMSPLLLQVADDQFGARIDRAAMAFGEVVEKQ